MARPLSAGARRMELVPSPSVPPMTMMLRLLPFLFAAIAGPVAGVVAHAAQDGGAVPPPRIVNVDADSAPFM